MLLMEANSCSYRTLNRYLCSLCCSEYAVPTQIKLCPPPTHNKQDLAGISCCNSGTTCKSTFGSEIKVYFWFKHIPYTTSKKMQKRKAPYTFNVPDWQHLH